jgi:hypothetical protein
MASPDEDVVVLDPRRNQSMEEKIVWRNVIERNTRFRIIMILQVLNKKDNYNYNKIMFMGVIINLNYNN